MPQMLPNMGLPPDMGHFSMFRAHQDAEWLFPFDGRQVLPRRLVYLAQQRGVPCPSLLCPCCREALSAATVAKHYYKSVEAGGYMEEARIESEEEMEEEKNAMEEDECEGSEGDEGDDMSGEADDGEVGEGDEGEDISDEGDENEDVSDEGDEDEDVSDEGDEAENDVLFANRTSAVNAARRFAQLLLEDMVRTGSQANTTRMLKAAHATIFPLLPFGLDKLIPTDARALETLAGKGVDVGATLHEFCPKDHYRFSPMDPSTTCPVCLANNPNNPSSADTRRQCNGRPVRQAVYFDLAAYVKRILTMPGLMEAQLSWEDRRSPAGTYRDAVDGSIMSGTHLSTIFAQVPPEQRRFCLVMSVCTDATRVREQGSMTPIVCQTLTLPEHVRKKFTSMYLAGVLPDGAKNSVYLEPVAEMFAAVAPGTEGINVNGTTFWVIKGWRVDDLGGIYEGVRAKKYPAINGACIQCKQQGVRSNAHHTTYYMGAFSHLPLEHELRQKVADAYAREETLNTRILTLTKPRLMTASSAYASAARMESGQLTEEEAMLESFHGFNVWTQLLYYFNVIFQTINDPFHELANTVKDIFMFIYSRKKFSPLRRAYERALGRYLQEGRPPFQASANAIHKLDAFVQSGRMRLPNGWPRVRFAFAHFSKLSCSERICLAGPLGLYFLQFCDVDVEIRVLFVELLNCLESVQAKVHTTASLNELQTRMVITLTKCEAALPLYWNTCVRHHLLHLVAFIQRCGPYDAFSMGPFERFHTLFKKLVRAKCGEMQSVINHYTKAINGDRWRCELDAPAETAAYKSTVAGATLVDYDISDIAVRGKQSTATLETSLYAQVQDMWCVRSKVYDKLRDRYRAELRRAGGFRAAAVLEAQIPVGWRPRRGRTMTEEEEKWLQMTPVVSKFKKAVIKGKYEFRTMQSERFLKTSNCVVKEWYQELEDGLSKGFGMIEDMFIHQAYPGGPQVHFVKAEWLDTLQELSCTGLTQVQRNPNNNFNLNSCLTSLDLIVPYNIALLPQSLDDPDCNVFAVIDPEARLGTYGPSS